MSSIFSYGIDGPNDKAAIAEQVAKPKNIDKNKQQDTVAKDASALAEKMKGNGYEIAEMKGRIDASVAGGNTAAEKLGVNPESGNQNQEQAGEVKEGENAPEKSQEKTTELPQQVLEKEPATQAERDSAVQALEAAGREVTDEALAAQIVQGRNAEIQKILKEKGIELESDRTIGGESEAKMLANFLQDNPDVDAQKLLDATGQLFKGMKEEDVAKALAEMTPDEYQKFLKEAVQNIKNIEEEEKKTGKAIDGGAENEFSLSEIGKATGNPKWRPSSYGSGQSGKMEGVPNISNTEMLKHCDAIAKRLGVEPAAVKAVVAVESAGKMNATRFEPHIYQRALKGKYGPGDRKMLSTSYGAFQIMGFNHKVSGFSTVEAMVEAMKTPKGQLSAFAGFIEGNPKIHNALKAKNWAAFAHGYNGPAYKQNNYDNKMAAAYSKYS